MKTAGPGISPNDIKKMTYKQQPKAILTVVRMGVVYYKFALLVEGKEQDSRIFFQCEVPVSDMGSTDFYSEMEAKHLLRWLDPNLVIGFENVKKEL